ncbi:CotH kinase family protein, partial [Candidatus Latescibacterota bacterium]
MGEILPTLTKTVFILLIIITLGFTAESTPLINEVMSSNSSTIEDENGDYSDWIEIYNPGDSPVDLTGYGLSDRPDNQYKWVFPNCTLNPGEHKLIFASGKDRTKIINYWETIIREGDDWQFFVGTEEPPLNWKEIGFKGGWKTGPSGFGYGYGNEATTIRTGSLYIRKTFMLDNVIDIVRCFFHMDYDDAFVAYINGTEIARSNIGEVGTPPSFDQYADGSREAEMYKGGDPEEFEIADIQSLLIQGENVLAIQVHNLNKYSSDLTAIPFLTFGVNVSPLEPEGFSDILPIPVDYYLHTNFKINSSGETILITDKSGNLCDLIDTGYIPRDLSRGRITDGGAERGYFTQPTPGKSNTSQSFVDFASPVHMSLPGGFYDNNTTVELSADSENAVIRYTLDGNEPTEESNNYTNSLSISATTVVKARAYENGLLPGKITTNTYFINQASTLAVISLSTDPANFWDDEIGIYVMGNNAESKIPYYGANFWQDWERPVHLEFYKPDGALGFSMDVGTKILGGYMRRFPQKTLAIFARGKYGSNTIDYQIFPDSPIREFKSFVLRNYGNDWENTLLRDPLSQDLIKTRDSDVQLYRPAVVYINGVYWGIHAVMEKQNEDYLASHHGVDSDNVDIMEAKSPYEWNGFTVIEGDREHFDAMMNFITNQDITDSSNYEYIKTLMQVDNYIDYVTTEIYYGNTDWPHNNNKFWRPRTLNGRWRWLVFDLDYAFECKNWTPSSHNTLEFATDPSNKPEAKLLLRKLLENSSFRNDFINRVADFMNSIFQPEFMLQRLLEMKKEIEPEIPNHIARWGDSQERAIHSVEDWEKKLDVVEEYVVQRPQYVYTHYMERFGIQGTSNISLNISEPACGKIKINSLEIDDFPWEGTYFQGVPVQIIALPNPGYRFAGWTGITPSDSVNTMVSLT